MKRKIACIIKWSLSALFILSISAPPAWAVQTHGGAEGLVSHQIGHVLFMIGVVSLIGQVYKHRINGPGWSSFKLFLWLILLWNCLTFSGHWLNEIVSLDKFIQVDGHLRGFHITTVGDAIFYASRLDHLVQIPAFIFLFLAIKQWNKAS